MIKYGFEFDESEHDGRSKFVNDIIRTFYDPENLGKSLKIFDTVESGIDEYVRNVYELVDSQIPLYRLYELFNGEPDNWDYTDDEYKQHIRNAKAACKEFYKCLEVV